MLVAALASPADAALYTAATRFVVLGQLFVQSVQQALSPQLSALFARGETSAANSVYQAATLWSMIAAWPLYLVLAGFAPALMGVFGDGYDVASDVVVILSLTMLLATACGPVDSVLLMAGRSWLSLRNSTVALAVNVGLNLVLIPVYGIRGAAIAWAVAIVVRNLLPLVQVRRHLGMWPLTRAAVQVALGAVACFGGVDVVVALTACRSPSTSRWSSWPRPSTVGIWSGATTRARGVPLGVRRRAGRTRVLPARRVLSGDDGRPSIEVRARRLAAGCARPREAGRVGHGARVGERLRKAASRSPVSARPCPRWVPHTTEPDVRGGQQRLAGRGDASAREAVVLTDAQRQVEAAGGQEPDRARIRRRASLRPALRGAGSRRCRCRTSPTGRRGHRGSTTPNRVAAGCRAASR